MTQYDLLWEVIVNFVENLKSSIVRSSIKYIYSTIFGHTTEERPVIIDEGKLRFPRHPKEGRREGGT